MCLQTILLSLWHDYDIESNYKFKKKPVQSHVHVYSYAKASLSSGAKTFHFLDCTHIKNLKQTKHNFILLRHCLILRRILCS